MLQTTKYYINKLGDEVYECPICNQEMELEHDKPFVLTGLLSGCNESFKCKVETEICEYCAVKIGRIEDV